MRRSTLLARFLLESDPRTTPRARLVRARLLLLWTRELCAGEPVEWLRRAVAGGVDIVQVREKKMTGRELYVATREARAALAGTSALVMVNDRADVALAARADGVHVGQDDLEVADAVALLRGGGLLVGASTHSLAQVREACAAGASLLGFGPMFETTTKPSEPPIGPAELAAAVGASTVPVFAIGGLDAARIAAIGARRAAISSAILRAADPQRAAREIRAALEANGPLDE